jgi:hypothetical protein
MSWQNRGGQRKQTDRFCFLGVLPAFNGCRLAPLQPKKVNVFTKFHLILTELEVNLSVRSI